MNDYLIVIPEITKGMKSLGSKALLKLNQKNTILDYQIKGIKSINRQNKIYLATGFQHHKVKQISEKYKNVNVIFEPEYEQYNEAKHIINFIKYKADQLNHLFVIKNGIMFKNKCFGSLKNKAQSKIYFLDRAKDNFSIGCHSLDSKYLFYDLNYRWSECIFLSKSDLETVRDMNKNNSISQYFIFEIINRLLDITDIQANIVSYKNIMKVNNTTDMTKAKRFC